MSVLKRSCNIPSGFFIKVMTDIVLCKRESYPLRMTCEHQIVKASALQMGMTLEISLPGIR